MTTSAPIPSAMLAAATKAIQRQQYTSPLVSRNLADAALAAAGYGELVAALENLIEGLESECEGFSPNGENCQYFYIDQKPCDKCVARQLLVRVHGEAGEGKQ